MMMREPFGGGLRFGIQGAGARAAAPVADVAYAAALRGGGISRARRGGGEHFLCQKVPRLTQLQPGYCALVGTDTSGPQWVCAYARARARASRVPSVPAEGGPSHRRRLC